MLDSVLRATYSMLAPGGARGRHSTLIFHRVLTQPDPLLPDDLTAEEFTARMRWTQRNFNVLPLGEAVTRLANGTLPPRSLSITFDDGYADNQQVAAPILSKLGMPATFFIATGFLDGGRMFNDTIIAAVRSCKQEWLDLSELGLGAHPIQSIEQRGRAISWLLPQIKRLDPAERSAKAKRVGEIAEVALPENLMMTSVQVRALVQQGFEIGAHTVNHPILSEMTREGARHEIESGRQRLQQIIDQPIWLFAYPNGRPGEDYTADTAELVRQCGFNAAFTTACGVARRDSDRFQLPRFTPWDRGDLKFGIRMAHNLLHKNVSLI